MNYFKNNLNNSSNLPYDVMRLIYEYADPLIAIKKQIENQNYDLSLVSIIKPNLICGVDPFLYNNNYYTDNRIVMINSLKYRDFSINRNEYISNKELYKLWVKL